MRLLCPPGDITQGVIWKQILGFFFPLWLGTFFQQLYNTVDTVVVGRFVGKAALAAVGSTAVIVNLTVGIFTGLASGAVVSIAQHYGARRWQEVHHSVHTAMMVAILAGCLFMTVGFLLTPWILSAMHTTPEAMSGAVLYLRIYFLGMIPNVIYNMGTGILRAVGDSRRPLYFLIAASLCNIVLDLVLVLGFHLGVAGVAIATICSQLLSAALVLLCLTRAHGAPFQLFLRELSLRRQPFLDEMRIGLPTALQSVMYNISNIVIQASINGFGTDAVAAWTAYGKVDVIFWMTLSAMGQAVTTFAGQNYGAGKYDRLKKSVWTAMGMTAGFAVTLSLIMYLLARPILAFFTPDSSVLEVGVPMMRFLVPVYITYIPVELLSGAIRGAGRSLVPMLISVFGVCGLRLLWLFLMVPLYHTIPTVLASYPITWVLTSCCMFLYYRFGHWLHHQPLPAPAEAL